MTDFVTRDGAPLSTPSSSLREARFDSGYGTLFRNVAASIEATDPDAAQALMRASVDVEEIVEELLRLRVEVAQANEGKCGSALYVD